MSPNDVLAISSVAGLFLWGASALLAWRFCVHSNPLWLRVVMKFGYIIIFARLAAATVGDMPLDYMGSFAYAAGAVIGGSVMIHHFDRVFWKGDRCLSFFRVKEKPHEASAFARYRRNIGAALGSRRAKRQSHGEL